MITLYQIVVPNLMQEGFSAFKSSASASANMQFTGWSVSAPYFPSIMPQREYIRFRLQEGIQSRLLLTTIQLQLSSVLSASA